MKIKAKINQVVLTNFCAVACPHFPYGEGSILKSDLNTSENFTLPDFKNGEVYILTGGEPFESKLLFPAIDKITKSQAYFRIATGGYINLRKFYIRLLNSESNLGINIGTDVILRLNNDHYTKIWLENWRIFGKLKNTWLTITLDGDIDFEKFMQLIEFTKPNTLMLNEIERGYNSFDKRYALIQETFPDITLVNGYRNESTCNI
ncbi:MAG: hypothetical protein LBI63_00910 [Candidatus Ancillula sp.]|jgi:MoaA/NifB/PqqE/SkfB family radical SAM enzyme|nr:hypothetical protein [Candidatus Ancillula sp.]